MPSGTRVWRTSITESGVAISDARWDRRSPATSPPSRSPRSPAKRPRSPTPRAARRARREPRPAARLSFDPISSSTRMSLPNPSTSNRAVPMTCHRFGPSTEAYSITPIRSTPAAVMLTSKSTDVITMNGENWIRASNPHEPYTPKPITSASSVKSAPHCTELDVDREVRHEVDAQHRPGRDPERHRPQIGEVTGRVEARMEPADGHQEGLGVAELGPQRHVPDRANPTTCESCRLASIDRVPASKSITPATSRLQSDERRDPCSAGSR